jgi:photosystem II stability/assembly factor-like uncharacterized protein
MPDVRFMRVVARLAAVVLISALLVAPGNSIAAAQDDEPNIFEQLTYRYIGPVGNRVSAVVGVPGDANVYFIGAASGGVFRSVDGGVSWEPVMDDQPVAAIGSLAIDPTNPNVVWAGTGETFIRSNILTGNGIYKTLDGGETWKNMGLELTGRIGRIVIDPLDPDTVFAAAMGHGYGPQQERGVYRTEDGGDTWEQVLFVDEHTGCADIVMDPNNPNILYAGMWPLFIRTWGRVSGGDSGGLWRSKDGGDTWEELTDGRDNGLPHKPIGKIGLGMTPDNSQRVYALIETSSNDVMGELDEHQGVLWRSDDGGESWRMVNGNHILAQRPLYYSRLAVAPDNQHELHFMSTRHSISLDGGETFKPGNAGGDNHDMWIDPLLPDRMIVGHDGGISISTTRGTTWARPRLPIAQMYHVFVDNKVPYFVMGNRQDGPSIRGPSNSLTRGPIPIGEWRTVGGCESGFAIPAGDGDIIWSGCYDGILDVHDIRTGHSRNVSPWPDNPEGWPAGELRYRFQWTFPIHISPHDPNTVYVGSQVVHRTTDQGYSWQVISPDLSSNDKDKQLKTGGLTYDDTSPTYAAVLFAIAESPVEQGTIYAGTNDGFVHITRDEGGNWENISDNMPELPQWSTISNIEPSRHAAGTAYVAVDTHQIGIFDPFLYKTTDFGQSWTRIDGGIPRSVLSYSHVIREDPARPGLLYAGTANAVYVSFNDGDDWQPLQNNLPHAPVHWLTIQDHFNDLVIGTYGRGFWVMDDITPLQQLTEEIRGEDAHLFAPRAAYRFHPVGQPNSGQDPAAGENPEYGASITYWIHPALVPAEPEQNVTEAGGAAAAPAGLDPAIYLPGTREYAARQGEQEAVEAEGEAAEQRGPRLSIEILDAEGETIRTLRNVPAEPGINRVYWDLRYESSKRARLRTKPLHHSHFVMDEDGTRPAVDGGPVVPTAPPGQYTVKLTVGEMELLQPLEVRKDPNSGGTLADIEAQFAMQLELRDDQNEVVEMIDEAESVRVQLGDLRELIAGREDAAEINEMIDALDEKIIDVEMNFMDLRLNGGQDNLRYGRQLYAKIASLSYYISGHDFRPTEAHRTVHEMYRENLGTYEAQMSEIRDVDIAALNQLLIEKGLGPVITGQEES